MISTTEYCLEQLKGVFPCSIYILLNEILKIIKYILSVGRKSGMQLSLIAVLAYYTQGGFSIIIFKYYYFSEREHLKRIPSTCNPKLNCSSVRSPTSDMPLGSSCYQPQAILANTQELWEL